MECANTWLDLVHERDDLEEHWKGMWLCGVETLARQATFSLMEQSQKLGIVDPTGKFIKKGLNEKQVTSKTQLKPSVNSVIAEMIDQEEKETAAAKSKQKKKKKKKNKAAKASSNPLSVDSDEDINAADDATQISAEKYD